VKLFANEVKGTSFTARAPMGQWRAAPGNFSNDFMPPSSSYTHLQMKAQNRILSNSIPRVNLFDNEDYLRQCALRNRCWCWQPRRFRRRCSFSSWSYTAFSNPNMDVATYSKAPARLCDYARAKTDDNTQSFKHEDRLGCSLKAPICLAIEYRIDESSQAPCGIASVATKHQGN
jgi:hypothetical protein